MNIKSKNDFLIVELEGEIDEYICSSIKPEIDFEYKEKGMKNMIFDFDKTTFIDSSTLGMLLGRYKRVSENDGEVFISGAKEQVDKVLEISDIYKLIRPYKNVDEIINE